jgi:predicted nucleotidyltransferase
MDKTEFIINKVRQYSRLVVKDFPVKIEQFWLYGSYAKGQQREDSDIDVALVVDKLDENYDFFLTEPILWRLRREIDCRISPVLIARDTDYGGLLDEIYQTGIEIKSYAEA